MFSENSEAQKYCIERAVKEGINVGSETQSPQWLREGVRIARGGGEITKELLEEINRRGGTDHHDPFA